VARALNVETPIQGEPRPSLLQRLREREGTPGVLLIAPTMLWLIIFLVVPLLLIVVISFAARGQYGDVVYTFSLDKYLTLFNQQYLGILWDSVWIAFLTTAFTLLAGYPLAYFIARSHPRWKSFFLFLILVPFWTNFLIRIYAWMILLRGEGVIAGAMESLGLMQGVGEQFFGLIRLYSPGAVLIGMVYEFLPFMLLPLYTSLDKLDPSLLEAAADLGARPWRTFLRVTLPLSLPGIIAGSILVFVPAMGMFVVPDLMGGARTVLVGNLVRNQFLVARDWPLGSAASMVLMILTLIVTLLYTRRFGFSEELRT
jgi:spermidine/putrescine transport system permease protein